MRESPYASVGLLLNDEQAYAGAPRANRPQPNVRVPKGQPIIALRFNGGKAEAEKESPFRDD
jgi:hypothetical protein